MEIKSYQDIKLSCQNMINNKINSIVHIGHIDYNCLDNLQLEFNCLEFKKVKYGLIINKKEQ